MGREIVVLRGKPTGPAGAIGIGDGQSPSRLPRMHFVANQIRTHRQRIVKIGALIERLAVGSAMISLLFLISCSSAIAGGPRGFSIKVFTSPDDQFWVNSVIIEGTREVMLVDAQLTKTSAEKVLQEIR